MFKVFSLLGWSAWLVCAAAGCAADDAVSQPECSAKVCAVNIFAKSLVTAPCVGYSVLVAYSTANGATLIQCSKFSEPEEDRMFIYDRLNRGAKAFEFDGGKTVSAESLTKPEGIADKFSSRPLCPAKNRKTAAEGELVFVEKQASDSQDNPYCYVVYHVVAAESGLTVRSDDGKELDPLSVKASEQWDGLKRKLAPYIAAGNPIKQLKQEVTASVKSQKASLYSAPDTATASRMYLLQGDKVEVIDDSKLKDGWCFVRYVTKTGRTIEKWAQAQDLELLHK